MIFDTHAHYDHKRFNSTRNVLLNQIFDCGITKIINPAISYESNFSMREKLKDYPFIKFAVGIHPNKVSLNDNNIQELQKEDTLRKLSLESRTVAIGETGLDYYYTTDFKEKQIFWFRKHIDIAKNNSLPLILHIREATQDSINILREYSFEKTGVVHCFNEDYKIAKYYLDMGFLLGIGGSITYPEMKNLRDVVKYIPLESILLETDAPFVKPLGWNGKNNSLSLSLIIKTIAEVRGISREKIENQTFENATKLFNF